MAVADRAAQAAPSKSFGPVRPKPPAPPKPPVVADRAAGRTTAPTKATIPSPTIKSSPPSSGVRWQPAKTSTGQTIIKGGTGVSKDSSGRIVSIPQRDFGGGPPADVPMDMGPEYEEYWWQPDWQDASYNAQLAAINRALADFETELGLKGERYGTDYTTGLRELGYRPGEGFKPTVDIFGIGVPATGAASAGGLEAVRKAMMPVTGAAQTEGDTGMARLAGTGGQWDYEGQFNPFSAASRGTRTTRDEFAGRGMLRSSDFAKNYADFQDRLQNQLTGMEQGRSRFFEDSALGLAQQRSGAEERRQSAIRDAMARAAGAGEFRERRV